MNQELNVVREKTYWPRIPTDFWICFLLFLFCNQDTMIPTNIPVKTPDNTPEKKICPKGDIIINK
ncbi:hypothetical protein, partial [Thalassobacillus sp. C254]|uniref:hypothetical protein n=1 Tax=Thalassobacillus sp. C254 TaxID=1225341 RepID=UPI0022B6DDC4